MFGEFPCLVVVPFLFILLEFSSGEKMRTRMWDGTPRAPFNLQVNRANSTTSLSPDQLDFSFGDCIRSHDIGYTELCIRAWLFSFTHTER